VKTHSVIDENLLDSDSLAAGQLAVSNEQSESESMWCDTRTVI